MGGAEGIDGVTLPSATQTKLLLPTFTASEIMIAVAAREIGDASLRASKGGWRRKCWGPDRKAYLDRLGAARLEMREVHEHVMSAAADFGC